MSYETVHARFEDAVCFLQLHRPQAKNAINALLVQECHDVLERCESSVNVVVLEGLPDVFCLGADFQELGDGVTQEPEALYDLWSKLATGPWVTISHVRGRANGGGVGFVAASDIVLADDSAEFSLSEMLFELMPACVLPFLIRRIGFQRAHYMSLMTYPISVQQAHGWNLVDAFEARSESLLRRHLVRLRCLSKSAIRNYKKYAMAQHDAIVQMKAPALDANRQMFANPQALRGITRFVETGLFPWQE